MILALNMMDIVAEAGHGNRPAPLAGDAGHPGDPGIRPPENDGLDILMHAAAHHKDSKGTEATSHHHTPHCQTRHRHDHHGEYVMVYSDEIEDKIDLLMDALKQKYPDLKNLRWHAIKLLENDTEKSPGTTRWICPRCWTAATRRTSSTRSMTLSTKSSRRCW